MNASSSDARARDFASIDRPRVVERFGEAARYRVVAVVAPAGFGKTVAIRQFLATVASDHVRYDVGSDTLTAVSFARGLASALSVVLPELETAFGGIVIALAPHPNVHARLADWFVERLDGYDGLIAIDGLAPPLTNDEKFIAFLSRLIEKSDVRTRWLVSTRLGDGMPLTSWMAYGAMGMPVDREDLVFDLDEATAVHDVTGSRLSATEVHDLHALTDGWPTAFTLALRASTRASTLRDLAGDSRAFIYRYLVEQIYGEFEEDEKTLLLRVATFPAIDAEVLEHIAEDAGAVDLEALVSKTSFLVRRSSSSFAFQGLFRDFLLSRLAKRGAAAFKDAFVATGTILEGLERPADALTAFMYAREPRLIARTLERNGHLLLHRGETELVETALRGVRREDVPSATLDCLRATIESYGGRFAAADALFDSALRHAQPKERLSIVNRRIADLLRRRAQSSEQLRLLVRDAIAYADAESEVTAMTIDVLGTIAVASATIGDMVTARTYNDRANALAASIGDDRIKANAYHQSSWIAYVQGDVRRALAHAEAAQAIASEQQLLALLARIASVRYNIHVNYDGDVEKAMVALTDMHEAARRAGDRYLETQALGGLLDAAAERGRRNEVAAIEAQLGRIGIDEMLPSTAVPPARALVRSWDDDFAGAYELVRHTAAEQPTALRRSLRASEIALYAAACGKRDQAIAAFREAIHGCRRAPHETPADRWRITRVIALTAFGFLVLGNPARANLLIAKLEAEPERMPKASRALVAAVRAAHLSVEVGESPTPAYAALDESGLGGLALLFKTLLNDTTVSDSPIARLTKAERDVLRAIAMHGTTAETAAALGRSEHTVKVHVKSIFKKLGCHSRHEAVRMGRRYGLIPG